MKHQIRSNRGAVAGLLVSLFVGFNAAQAATPTKTENFDSAASAALNGWTGFNNTANGNNYGFSNSNNTGGNPAGEAGGIFSRATSLSYYADTTVGDLPFMDLFNRLEARGELALVTAATQDTQFDVGFFDRTESPIQYAAFLGFRVGFDSGGGFAISSQGVQQGGTSGTLGVGTYTWSMVYDPNFSSNDGRVTTVFTNSVGSQVLEVHTDIASGAKIGRSARTGGYFNIDAFGLLAGENGSTVSDSMEAYIDGLVYTIPETTSAVLLLVASAFLRRRRWGIR
jgi:hypothetical protein